MTLLEKANKSNGLLQLKLNGHQLNTVANSGNTVNRVKSVITKQFNLQHTPAIQLPILRSTNNSVNITTTPSIINNSNNIATTISPSVVITSSARQANQPSRRSLASFMANRCCVCSRLLRNYRGNRLAKSYEITIDPNDLISSRSHDHHLNGDASTLVNNNTSNNTNRSNDRISRLLTKHLALSSAAVTAASSSSSHQNGDENSNSVSQKKKLCQSCYDHLNQIDSHMKSVIRLRSLMKAKLRKSLRLVSTGNKSTAAVLSSLRRSNRKSGFVSSDLIVKSENINNNNRIGSTPTARSASNKVNLRQQLMINAAANSNTDGGLASSTQASSSSISSSPSATSLSPANVYSSHLNQNGNLAGLYIQPQTDQLLRLNTDLLALLAASGSLSNSNNNTSFELASLANMDLKPTLISPPSSSSNRRKRKSQNPSRLLDKGDLDENNNNQMQANNNQALNMAKLVAETTTVKSRQANMAKQQQLLNKTKTTKTTINITDNQASRSIGKLRSSATNLANANALLSHFIPNNKENDVLQHKRRSLQVKSDLDDDLEDEHMINDDDEQVEDEQIKNNDHEEENNNEQLEDEEPIDDPEMMNGDNSQAYDDPMYDEEEEDEDDDEANHHQMNGFDEEDDEENNNNSNNDELGGGDGAYGAEEGDDEEEDEEEDHSLVGGGLLRSQGGRGLTASTSTTTLTHHNNIPIKHLFEAAHNAAQQRVKLNTNQVRNTNSVGLKSKKYSLTNGDMKDNNTNQVANVLLSMSGSSNGKSSSSSANNIHHSSNNNDPEFKHNCTICRKSFKTQNILRQHMRIHTGDKPFVCDLCNKAFSQMASLKYHQATHSDDRPYKCDGCAKTFKLKPPFKKHIKDCPQRLAILGANPGSSSSTNNNNAALISLLNASGLAGLVDHDDDNDDDNLD